MKVILLAFIGSTRSWAEPAIPTLVVKFPNQGENCGVIFDSTQWDTGAAINGYVAYNMSCNEEKGEQLPLKSVQYPERFVLP